MTVASREFAVTIEILCPPPPVMSAPFDRPLLDSAPAVSSQTVTMSVEHYNQLLEAANGAKNAENRARPDWNVIDAVKKRCSNLLLNPENDFLLTSLGKAMSGMNLKAGNRSTEMKILKS